MKKVTGPLMKSVTSRGIAEYEPKENIEDLVKRADMNMYTAKSKGKNQLFYSRA